MEYDFTPLDDFIANAHFLHSEWICFRDIAGVYLRFGYVGIDCTNREDAGERYLARTVCIANVDVEKPKRGKGWFTAFISYLEEQQEELNRVVRVENALNPRLADFLRKRGYQETNLCGVPSFNHPSILGEGRPYARAEKV